MRKTFELENNFEKFQKMTITTLEIVKYSKMTLSLRSKCHTKILNWVNMKKSVCAGITREFEPFKCKKMSKQYEGKVQTILKMAKIRSL